MSGDHRLKIAADIRKLASDIEETCKNSSVMSMTYATIAGCCSRLCAEARIIELNVKIENMDALGKLSKLRTKKARKP